MDPKGKILIVDDDSDFVKTTEMILKSGGYEVAVATDARKGLDRIKESRPDLVVLDIMMESIFEGFSFLSTLRTAPEFEQFKFTPVLMVSSVKNDTGSRFMFEDEGNMGAIPQPDDFMDKPLKPNALLGKVASLIRKSH
ncbi:MAG: response regulator [Syntrophobacteraceae bacterium]